jgi:pyruvate dehydrogenase E1 component beta subunit
MEHLKLYRSFRAEVPDEPYTVPIGVAGVVREGSDVTLITYGAMVHTAVQAADELQRTRGASVEVIDLRTVMPLDIETLVTSVKKTHRAIVVQEAQRTAGVAAEVIAQVTEEAILHLEAPIMRITAPDTVMAFGQIEEEWLPSVARIVAGLVHVLDF